MYVFGTLHRCTLKRVKCSVAAQGFNVSVLLWILFHLPAANEHFTVLGPELLGIVHTCITLNIEVSIYARKSPTFSSLVI